jgi:hypothetical protein
VKSKHWLRIGVWRWVNVPRWGGRARGLPPGKALRDVLNGALVSPCLRGEREAEEDLHNRRLDPIPVAARSSCVAGLDGQGDKDHFMERLAGERDVVEFVVRASSLRGEVECERAPGLLPPAGDWVPPGVPLMGVEGLDRRHVSP